MGVHFILMSKRLLLCEGSLLMSLPIFVASLHWICNRRTLLFIFLQQSKHALFKLCQSFLRLS